MPTARLLPLVVALAVAMTGSAVSAAAPTTRAGPAKAPPAKAPTWSDMTFYVVHGDADACGRGCSEWIAAEGKIDAGAASRLRRVLAKLGRRKPIIFFHSPGGLIVGSMELGRLIREQKLTVSVGHTIPHGCERDKPPDKACEALKRSGQELAGELDQSIALCASACVYALAGGANRLVPPWVKLGIHDIGFDPSQKPPRALLAEVKRTLRDKLQGYLRDMGFDKTLLAAASAVPNESMKFVERAEIIRFGLDRREFGEAAWYFADKPVVLMLKGFFAHALDDSPPRYRNGIVMLSCVEGRGIVLALGQEHAPAEPQSPDVLPLRITINGKEVDLGQRTTAQDLDIHANLLPADMLEAVGDDATITLSAIAGSEDGSARDVTLSMDGFSAAFARLQKSCNKPSPNPFAGLAWPQATPYAGPSPTAPLGPLNFKTTGPYRFPDPPIGGTPASATTPSR